MSEIDFLRRFAEEFRGAAIVKQLVSQFVLVIRDVVKLPAAPPSCRIAPGMQNRQHYDLGIFDIEVNEEREVANFHTPDICKNRRNATRRVRDE